MARSTRRSTAQRVAGLATMGLPSPIKTVAGSRLGAPLTLLAMGALLITGVVTVEWSNGFPSIAVDRQRASQVQHTIVERVENVWDERTQGAGGVLPFGVGGQPAAPPTGPGFAAQGGQGQSGAPWPPTQGWGPNGGGYPAYQSPPQTYGAPAPAAYGPPGQPYYNNGNNGPPATPNYGQPAMPNYGQPVAPNYNGPAAPTANPAQPESGLSRLRDVLHWNR